MAKTDDQGRNKQNKRKVLSDLNNGTVAPRNVDVCATSHLSVVLEGLVWRAGEVKVEPRHPSVVTANNKVVPRGMNVDAADPLAPAD